MKSYRKIIVFVISALCLAAMANSSIAQEYYGKHYGSNPWMKGGHAMGYEMGNSMMRGYGMGPFIMGWGNFVGMKLSPEQKSKIKEIQKEARAKHWALMGQMMDEYEKQRELYEAKTLDPVAINNQHKIIEELRAQRRTVSINAHNQINSILTEEQREESKKWWRGHHNLMWGF